MNALEPFIRWLNSRFVIVKPVELLSVYIIAVFIFAERSLLPHLGESLPQRYVSAILFWSTVLAVSVPTSVCIAIYFPKRSLVCRLVVSVGLLAFCFVVLQQVTIGHYSEFVGMPMGLANQLLQDVWKDGGFYGLCFALAIWVPVARLARASISAAWAEEPALQSLRHPRGIGNLVGHILVLPLLLFGFGVKLMSLSVAFLSAHERDSDFTEYMRYHVYFQDLTFVFLSIVSGFWLVTIRDRLRIALESKVGRPVWRTVVVADLCKYSPILAQLAGILPDSRADKALKEQIRWFMDEAIQSVTGAEETNFIEGIGDGGILAFDKAITAHEFAAALLQATKLSNERSESQCQKRYFHIGAATGEVIMGQTRVKISGIAVARATRLQGEAKPGECVIDEETFKSLPRKLQEAYGAEEMAIVKHNEQFRVRRFRL